MYAFWLTVYQNWQKKEENSRATYNKNGTFDKKTFY